MENKYTIKVAKTKEDGTKYFVIQEYSHKDKLSRYEEKMAKYRKNLQRKAKKRALYESQFVIVEEEVKLPYKIITTKPRADHGIKTDCIFQWTETALVAKKALADMKTEPVAIGNHLSYRHPKLSDLTFKKQEPITKMDKEEYRIFVNQENAIKKMSMENRKFSEFHNKLIATIYSTENHALKKAARKAVHETKIQKLMKFLREKKLARYKYRLEFRKLKGTEPTVFITNYSNKKFEYLSGVMSRLATKLLDKINDFASINIYNNKTNKLLKVATGWIDDDIYLKTKLANMKALYPDYYKNVA